MGSAGVHSGWQESRPDRGVKRFIAPSTRRVYSGGAGRSPMPPYRRRQFLKGSLALAGLGLLSGWAIMPALGPPRKPARIGYLTLSRYDSSR